MIIEGNLAVGNNTPTALSCVVRMEVMPSAIAPHVLKRAKGQHTVVMERGSWTSCSMYTRISDQLLTLHTVTTETRFFHSQMVVLPVRSSLKTNIGD